MLLFSAYNGGGADLYLIPDAADKSTPVLLINQKSRTEYQTSSELYPSWSPDSQWIAFYSDVESEAEEKRYGLFIVPATGNAAPRKLADNVLPQSVIGPTWSPDSTSIIYVERSDTQLYPIYIVNIETRKQHLLETQTEINQDLAWSPKGDQIAFTAQGPGGWKQIKTYRLPSDVSANPNLNVSPMDASEAQFIGILSLMNRKGEPIADAKISVDGKVVGQAIDGSGTYMAQLPAVTGEPVAFHIQKAGYITKRYELIPKSRYAYEKIVLHRQFAVVRLKVVGQGDGEAIPWATVSFNRRVVGKTDDLGQFEGKTQKSSSISLRVEIRKEPLYETIRQQIFIGADCDEYSEKLQMRPVKRKIQWKIVDSDNKPIHNVTVSLDDKVIGHTDRNGWFSEFLRLIPGQTVHFKFSKPGWHQEKKEAIKIGTNQNESIIMPRETKNILLEIVDTDGKPIPNPSLTSNTTGVWISQVSKRNEGKITLTTNLPPESIITETIAKSGYTSEKLRLRVPSTPSVQIIESLHRQRSPRKKWGKFGLWFRYSPTPHIDRLSDFLDRDAKISDGAGIRIQYEGAFTRTIELGVSQMNLTMSPLPIGSKSNQTSQPTTRQRKIENPELHEGEMGLSTKIQGLYVKLGLESIWRLELDGLVGILVVDDSLFHRYGSIPSPNASNPFKKLRRNGIDGLMGGGTLKVFLPYSIVLFGTGKYLSIENIDQNRSIQANAYRGRKRSGFEYEAGIRYYIPRTPLGIEAVFTKLDLEDLQAHDIRFGLGIAH